MRRTRMMMTVTIAMSGARGEIYGCRELIWAAWTVSQRHNHRVEGYKKKGHPGQEEVQVGERVVIGKGKRVLKWYDSPKARRNR